jgi:hypothetical protein
MLPFWSSIPLKIPHAILDAAIGAGVAEFIVERNYCAGLSSNGRLGLVSLVASSGRVHALDRTALLELRRGRDVVLCVLGLGVGLWDVSIEPVEVRERRERVRRHTLPSPWTMFWPSMGPLSLDPSPLRGIVNCWLVV